MSAFESLHGRLILFEIGEAVRGFPAFSLRQIEWIPPEDDESGLEVLAIQFDTAHVDIVGYKLKSLMTLIHQDNLFLVRTGMNPEDDEAPEVHAIRVEDIDLQELEQ